MKTYRMATPLTWRSGTWFSGGLGSVRFTVGLNDLKDLFQPKWFYDSEKGKKQRCRQQLLERHCDDFL